MGNSIVSGIKSYEYNKNVELNNKLAGYSQQLTNDINQQLGDNFNQSMQQKADDLTQQVGNSQAYQNRLAQIEPDEVVVNDLTGIDIGVANGLRSYYRNDLANKQASLDYYSFENINGRTQASFDAGYNRGYGYFTDSIYRNERFAENNALIAKLNQQYYDDHLADRNQRLKEIAEIKQGLANSDYVFKLDKPQSRVPSDLNNYLTNLATGATFAEGVARLKEFDAGIKFGTTLDTWQDSLVNQRIMGVTNYTGIGGPILPTNINDISKNSQWLFNTNYAANAFKLGSTVDDSFRSLAKLNWYQAASGLDKFGKGLFKAQMVLGGLDFAYNAGVDYIQTGSISTNTWKIGGNAVIDTAFGALGTYGGPIGVVSSLAWTYRESFINSEIQHYKNELKYGYYGPKY